MTLKKNHPLHVDPTLSNLLRRRFIRDMNKRFANIKRFVTDVIDKKDEFGFKKVQNQKSKDNSVVMLRLPAEVSKRIRMNVKIRRSDLLEKETFPHITVRYGLHADKKQIESYIKSMSLKSLDMVPTEVEVWEHKNKDVLVLRVKSDALPILHGRLGALPHTDIHPEYKPHITIAYLKKGRGTKYLNSRTKLEGLRFDIKTDQLVFGNTNHNVSKIAVNKRFEFNTDDEKAKAFRELIQDKTQKELLNDEFWNEYIEQGFERGMGRAFDQARFRGGQDSLGDFYDGNKRDFLKSSFRRPVPKQKVKLLASRVFTDLKGVTDQMDAAITKSLVDGMIAGKSGPEIAKDMKKVVGGFTKRAHTLARTEITRAHGEGQLQILEDLGVEHVGVMVEWSTAGDERVCEKCRPLDGIVMKIEDAHNLLPRHPNCRCAFIPANVGEDTSSQKRTKTDVKKAIRKSLKVESKEQQEIGQPRTTIDEQAKISDWEGGRVKFKKLPKKRPSGEQLAKELSENPEAAEALLLMPSTKAILSLAGMTATQFRKAKKISKLLSQKHIVTRIRKYRNVARKAKSTKRTKQLKTLESELRSFGVEKIDGFWVDPNNPNIRIASIDSKAP